MEVKVKIVAIKSDNKAFKASDDSWYNVNTPVIPYLEKMSKGDEVVVTFEKKGTSRYVSLLTLASAKTETTSAAETTSEFKCEVCGKTLKDGKYKVCFTCNKAGKTAPSQASSAPTTGKSYNSYNDPAKTAQIQRGNALNASAAVASGVSFQTPQEASEFTLELANSFLDWLRSE
jgi:hypothetical protein